MELNTPIFIAAFNRPSCVRQVLNVVRQVKTSCIYVCLDGPRPTVPGDYPLCLEVREIFDELKRDRAVIFDVASANMGCGRRLSSGLTAFFSRFDRGIVLEDDTIPSLGFFRFCEGALEKYKQVDGIGHIAGSRFELAENGDVPARSIHPHIWGWATWARAWRHYDFSMSGYAQKNLRDAARDFVDDPFIWRRWTDAFERVWCGKIDTWDYQWAFACWANRMEAIVPPVNLIRNVGFGADATHTKSGDGGILGLQPKDLDHDISWTEASPRDHVSDRQVQLRRYGFMPDNSRAKILARRLWWRMSA